VLNTRNLRTGSHTLAAMAYDRFGNVCATWATVTTY
jgi:hypothetical protein